MQNNLKASLYILNSDNYRESVKIHSLAIYTIKRKYVVQNWKQQIQTSLSIFEWAFEPGFWVLGFLKC